MFGSWPTAHVNAYLGNDLECGTGADSVNPGKINSGHLLERILYAAGRFSVRIAVVCIKGLELLQYLLITVSNLSLVELIQFNRLLEAEQMFLAEIAF